MTGPEVAEARRSGTCGGPANPCEVDNLVVIGETEGEAPPTHCELYPWDCDGGGDGDGGGNGPDDDGGGTPPGTSPTPPDTTVQNPCATGDPVLDAPEVGAFGLNELWKASSYGPTTPQAERREVAAWVRRLADGTIILDLWDGVAWEPCRVRIPVASRPPDTIAFVHTHPWTVGETVTTCTSGPRKYEGIPSESDVGAATALGLPGYVLDADGITRFTAATQGKPVPRCGY